MVNRSDDVLYHEGQILFAYWVVVIQYIVLHDVFISLWSPTLQETEWAT